MYIIRSMGKIKVVHIVTLLELGGAQQNTLFTVKHLDRSKFEVSLICGEGAILDEEARKIPDLKTDFVKSLVRPVSPLNDLACLFQLTGILKRQQPDIVHTHSSKAGIIGRIAARLAKVPVVVHSIHGFGFNPYQKWVTQQLFITLEKQMAGLSDKLIAVSQENIDLGLSLNIGNPELYTLIRSGVDIAKIRETAKTADGGKVRAEFKVPAGRKVILNIGPFKLQKDPVSFIRLADKVVKSDPTVEFWMAGDGELRPEVEAEIAKLGLADRVRLLGWRRDIPDLLNACDLFVMTSLWEGLPRAAVEALIVGRPVVAFSANGLVDIIRDDRNGYLLKPGDLDGMARKISNIFAQPELANNLSRGAAETIDDAFDIHKMVRRQEELYLGLMSQRKNLTKNGPVVNILA